MSTASITHRPIPLAAVAAAAVAVLAFAGVTVAQHDSGTTTTQAPSVTSKIDLPNPDAHYQRPMHTGVQAGMP